MADEGTFERVRREIARDLSAVKPLRPASILAGVSAPLALSVLVQVGGAYSTVPATG